MSKRDSIVSRNQADSPFLLENEMVYQQWRQARLAHYPAVAQDLMVHIRDPFALTQEEHDAITMRCRNFNMAFYDCGNGTGESERGSGEQMKAIPAAIGRQFGLQHLDGHLCTDEENISALKVMPLDTVQEGYIPYSDRPINWHTDGYYNTPDHRIRGMLLHCACDAAQGGSNEVLDHEIAYLLIRDENPDYITALMQPDVMTIPANVVEGKVIRAVQTGPVFYIDDETGSLYMRYTARARNVVWKQDALTQAAVRFIQDLFSGNGDYIFKLRMQPGQGLICNNVLHNRTGFHDDPETGKQRLVYRARYYDRIQGTGLYA